MRKVGEYLFVAFLQLDGSNGFEWNLKLQTYLRLQINFLFFENQRKKQWMRLAQ